MSHADQLIEIATELALDAKDEVADLQRKLSAVETAKIEIEARLRTANHALGRLSSFVSIRGSDLQCPRCWINNEVIASLRPAGGGIADTTIFDVRAARAISNCKFEDPCRHKDTVSEAFGRRLGVYSAFLKSLIWKKPPGNWSKRRLN
jgi:hypothetical protein